MSGDLRLAILVSLLLHAVILGAVHLGLRNAAPLSGSLRSASEVEGGRLIVYNRRETVSRSSNGSPSFGSPWTKIAPPAAATMERVVEPEEQSRETGASRRRAQTERSSRRPTAKPLAASVAENSRLRPPTATGSLGGSPGDQRRVEPRPAVPIQPEYPFGARRRGYEGTVVFTVVVSPAGAVLDLRLDQSSGFEELDEAARRAIRNADYLPGSDSDPMAVRVRVVFRLS